MREKGRQERPRCLHQLRVITRRPSFGAEEAYIEQYRQNIDVFFGIEHSKKKRGCRTAVQQDEEAVDEDEEDKKHRSGGVFLALHGAVSSVVNKEVRSSENVSM